MAHWMGIAYHHMVLRAVHLEQEAGQAHSVGRKLAVLEAVEQRQTQFSCRHTPVEGEASFAGSAVVAVAVARLTTHSCDRWVT